jgi:IS605 OrfB family transposase
VDGGLHERVCTYESLSTRTRRRGDGRGRASDSARSPRAGEPGKTGGNETIRVSVGGYLEIDLPAALCGHANQPRGRYRLATPITFAHRRQEHENVATTRHSIGYRVRYDAARERWYVDASFSPTHPDRPSDLQAIRASGIVSVDLNEHHVSVARVDQHGNLAARPFDLPLDLTGSTSRRDAQLRDAFSRIIDHAKQHDCAVAIEDLSFEDEKATARESYRKRFRRTLSGLPTGIVRERLRSMTATAGVPLLAADPAYTSKDGRAHWVKPLNLTTHQAAALCIGRRALDLRLTRRASNPTPIRGSKQASKLAGVGRSRAQSLLRRTPGRSRARPAPALMLRGPATPAYVIVQADPRPFGADDALLLDPTWVRTARFEERLDQHEAGSDKAKVPWSYKVLCSEITAAQRREFAPWQTGLSCATYMTGFEALGATLQNFSRARKNGGAKVGFPRFKAKGRCRESVYSQGAHTRRRSDSKHDERGPHIRDQRSPRLWACADAYSGRV